MMNEITIVHICAPLREGGPLGPRERVDLQSDPGMEKEFLGVDIEPTRAEIILLDEADIDTIRAGGNGYEPGDYGETLVLSGETLQELGIGSMLRVGDVTLEITRVGLLRDVLTNAPPGLSAHILSDGIVSVSQPVAVLDRVPRDTIQAAVLTVSDRCHGGEAVDTSGPAVAAKLSNDLGARITATMIVADEIDRIASSLKDLAARGIDLVITTGGTGCAPRDVTPEATRSVIEREAPGLAEAMRRASADVTRHALLQRGVCGILRSTLIVNLPGSEKAAIENLAAVSDVIPHAIKLLRGDTAHAESDIGRIIEPSR